VNGTVGVPQSTSQSILRNLSRVSKVVSNVDLQRQTNSPLSGVTVELWAVRDEGDIGEVEYLKLGQALTGADGKYQISILGTVNTQLPSLSKTSCVTSPPSLSKTICVTSLASLYISTHLVKIKLKRPNFSPPIDKSITFRPSVNNKILGEADSSVDLTIDASIDVQQGQNLKVEVISTRELEEWDRRLSGFRTDFAQNPGSFDWNPNEWIPQDLSERLVIQEQVDLDGNGDLDETQPLVVFDKPQIQNLAPVIRKKSGSDTFGKIVRIFEMDADGDSAFGEGADLVSASIFGGDSSRGQLSSFVDLFSEGEVLSSQAVAALDVTSPVVQFIIPLPQNPPAEVSGDLNIRLEYSDETAIDLSSLKVWLNEKIEFLNPLRFTLAPGADFAQQFFQKERDSLTGKGVGTFTLENVIFALGPRSHTLFASIKDFAGNLSQAQVTFVVNAAPEFETNTPRVFPVSEGIQLSTTRIQIFDVDRMDVELISLSGSLPPNIFLTTSTASGSPRTNKLFKLDPVSGITSSEIEVFLNVQSNHDLALSGNRVLQIVATDFPKNTSGIEQKGTEVPFSLTLRAIASNNPPDLQAICWTNEIRPDNIFRQSPHSVCTVLNTTEELRYCRTSASATLPLTIDENKLAQFTLCGFELDSEDEISFEYAGITRTGSGEDQETTAVPEFTSEFFFIPPVSTDYAWDSTSVFLSSSLKESTISTFQWKPFGNEFRDENILVFRATDNKGNDGVRSCLGNLALSEDLIGFYGFEEAAGTLVADLISGNDGFLTGDVLRVPGTIQQALFFDGVNDRLDTIRTVDLQIQDKFSLEIWVRPQSFPGLGLQTGTILISEDQTLYLKLTPSGNSYQAQFGISTSIGSEELSGGTLNPLQWHHIVVVYDSSSLTLFVDGQQASSSPLSGAVQSSFSRLSLGIDQLEKFRGKLDDFKIYRSALQNTDIQIASSCVASVEQSIILSVTTVEDAPFIESVNTLGLVTGEFPGSSVYADKPFRIQIQSNPDFFEAYREVSNSVLFKAQQGEPIEIIFEGNDDENRFSIGNADGKNAAAELLQLAANPDWLTLSQEPLEGKTFYALVLEGTPTSQDSVLIQTIDILSDDPGGKAKQENLYRFHIEVLDQNDQPYFLEGAGNALSQTPPSLSPLKSVTITLASTEDQPLTFWIHSFDIDPVPPTKPKTSPYFNPELFTFQYNAPVLARLNTEPLPIELEPYSNGATYRSAKIQWTPGSVDTGENLPAGVGAIKENKILIQTRAVCPALSLLIDNCLNQVNTVDVRIEVLSVDEAPKFRSLFLNNLPLLDETGEVHSLRIVDLAEGVRVELKQEIKDEENQAINDIVIKKEDTSLSSFKSNFTLVNVAKGGAIGVGSQNSFVVMTGAPQVKDYIDLSKAGTPICSLPLWVNPDETSQCSPPVVSMTLEALNAIAATGATTVSTKVLKFRVADVADPIFFVDPATHNPAVRLSNSTTNVKFNADRNVSALEDTLFTLELAAYNDSDKDPQLWDGFQFFLLQLPDPPGDISINSNTFKTTNTTAVLSWTPRQEHVEGTEDKVHSVIVRACVRDPQKVDPTLILASSCRDQRFKINVNAVADPPIIFFGEGLRNLEENPITPANPFLVFEDALFERLIRVEDEDLQSVNLQASFSLAAVTGSVDVAARSSGTSLSSTNETIQPPNFEPIDGDEGTNFVETLVSWETIDFDDLFTTSIGSHPTVATYVLHLEANTRGVSDASGKTVTDVFLEVRSVNDIPTFTTGIIGPILQTDGQDTLTTTIDLLDLVTNEEGDPLSFTLIDKGTAGVFLADLSATESNTRTRILHLTSSPGENGVADHSLVLKVEERDNPDNSTIAQLILQVTDSNDPPKFEDNPLFTAAFTLTEGESKVDTLDVLDADLLSAESLELVTFTVVGSFDSSFSNPTLLFSDGTNFSVTANFSFFGTTVPAPLNSPRALFQFTFSPRKLTGNSPFGITTYYLQFTATDRFKEDDLSECQKTGDSPPCPKSDITTVAFEILPVDNRPSFVSINQQAIGTLGVIPICVTTPTCFEDDFFARQQDPASLSPFLFAVKAEDQETEPLSFQFSSPLGVSLISASIDNLTFAAPPFSSSPLHPTSPDSVFLSFIPTNGNVGLETFVLKVTDPGQGGGASVNSTRTATREFSILVQNAPDKPEFLSIEHQSIDVLSSVSAVVFYEDRLEEILISIDDLDLYIPKGFSEAETFILTSSYGLDTTGIRELERELFPPEFFSYQLMNLTSFAGLQILSSTTNNQILFEFSSPANLVQTTPENFAKLHWAPEERFTFPKFNSTEFGASGGDIIWKLRARSFASNSIDSLRPTSIETLIRIRVFPVNDQPVIQNTKLEALATQDQAFTFAIQGIDEEENSLLYIFETRGCDPDSVPPIVPPTCNPGDMDFDGADVQWNPTNEDTISPFYDIKVFAQDTGKVSDISVSGLPPTTPLSSELYTLRIFLNDLDDPAIRSGSVNPLTQTTEDSLYITGLKYSDPDFFDTLSFHFHLLPPGMTIEDDDLDGEATIRWIPNLPGSYPVIVRIDSSKNSALRSSVFFNFNVEVTPVNDPPFFRSLPLTTLKENDSYLYNIDVTDEDDTSSFLTLLTQDIPELNLSCDPNPQQFVELFASDRKLQGSTNLAGLEDQESSLDQEGLVTSIDICIQASDGLATATQAFTLIVQADNNPPTIEQMIITSTPVGSSQLVPTQNPYSQLDLLITSEPLVYKDPSLRTASLFQGVENQITMIFTDEEGDYPLSFQELEGPGVTLTQTSAPNLSHVTLTLTWTPQTSHIVDAPTIKIRAIDDRNKPTDLIIRTRIADTPDLPTFTFNKTLQFIDEDLPQTISLGGVDPDLDSVLSYSIVPFDTTTSHPVKPLFRDNPFDLNSLQLEINNQGSVTFLSQVSSPAVLISAPDQVPVTFSICGSPRITGSGFESDCVTATYRYQILSRDDKPFFSPSIPSTVKTTAKEGDSALSSNLGYTGGSSAGLTFRKVRSTDPCPLETSQEICVIDEESTTSNDLFGTKTKVQLFLSVPAVPPGGLLLTDPQEACYVVSSGASCPLSSVPFQCSLIPAGCSSAQYTVVQTLSWNSIPFDQPTVRNIEVIAQQSQDSTKQGTFTFSLEIENTNRVPIINNSAPLVPELINESSTFTYSLADRSTDADGDPLVYEITQGVSKMTINTNSGLITWTPNASHIGEHLIELRVRDLPSSGPALSYTTNLEITVLRKNNPPIIESDLRKINDISSTRSTIATEALLFEAKIFARDEEGDAFSFFPSLSTLNGQPLPVEFDLTSFGRIAWTPPNSFVGPNTLLVVVKDTASGSSSSQEFDITVKNVNSPPVILNSISEIISVSEQELFTHSYSITDPDAADNQSYSVSVSPFLSASISPLGVLLVQPLADDAGTYVVDVTVSDNGGLTDTNTFTLEVLQKNNPPSLELIPDPLFVNRANIFNYQLFANDPEQDTLTFFFEAKPTNVDLDQDSGLLTITPLALQGQQEFIVFCQDSIGQESSHRVVKLRFIDSAPPLITSVPEQVGKILTEYTYTVESDAPEFAVQLLQGPLGMVVPVGQKVLIWTPSFTPPTLDQSGVYVVILRITTIIDDEPVQSAPQRYLLTISKENDSPTLELAQDVNGISIDTYDASQGVTFLKTIMTVKDLNVEDLSRLDFYFFNTNRSKLDTSTPLSSSLAQLQEVPGTRIIKDGVAQVDFELVWTPDNVAAFAVPNGDINDFVFLASDGITESESVAIEFNVTNKNDLPVFFDDENQGVSEIAFVGKTYRREFFARDLDKQITYFCLDTTKFFNPVQAQSPPIFPSLSPITLVGSDVVLSNANSLTLEGDGPLLITAGAVPNNTICRKGTAVTGIDDPNPERGKLSKATLVWEPTEDNINTEPFEDLPLTLWDNVQTTVTNTDPKFTLKLAPVIRNLVPNIQYTGEEVVISGDGIVLNENQLNIKFLRSDGSISAVTEVFDLSDSNPGQGKFIVPKGTVIGFLSVGFTSFSSPVPFTVLDGKTSLIAGSTNVDQDLLSSPSGLAVTYITPTSAVIFVSNTEYHTIHTYLRDENTGLTSSLGILSGQIGRSGDATGNRSQAQFNFPTGLSLAHRNSKPWLIVADTNNNKIKAIDISEIYTSLDLSTSSFPAYSLATSTHLNRPYKAIQHSDPTSSDYFFIANTFNNTIEMVYLGSTAIEELPEREPTTISSSLIYTSSQDPFSLEFKTLPNITNANVDGSQNTYTVAGTGYSRVDAFGNLFHPIDLAMTPTPAGYSLLVNSYSNYKYSFNNSFKVNLYSGPDRNLAREDDANIRYQSNITVTNDLMAADFGADQSNYDGDVLLVSQSNRDEYTSVNGLSAVIPQTGVPRTDKGQFLITGMESLYTQPVNLASQVSNDIFEANFAQLENLPSTEKTLYQTFELEIPHGVTQVGFIKNPNPGFEQNTAAILVQPATREITVTPLNDDGIYAITSMIKTRLPAEIGNEELGEPFYYDTNQDFVDDMFLPVPNLSSVYVFPGRTAAPPSPPLTFDTQNYWLINSSSFGTDCSNGDCLGGVLQVTVGRAMGFIVGPPNATNQTNPGQADLDTNRSILRGEDLILVSTTDLDSSIKIVDAYGWTEQNDADGASIAGYRDMKFHINYNTASPAGTMNDFTTFPTGVVVVDFDSAPYQDTFVRTDNVPEQVCVGHFTNFALKQSCANQEDDDGTCLKTTTEGSSPELTDVALNWVIDDDINTTPVFSDLSGELLNLEQIFIRFAAGAGTSVHPLALIGAEPVGDGVYTVSVSERSVGPIHCGQPIRRANRILTPRVNELDLSRAFINGGNQFGKPDSLFFTDSTFAFKAMDMVDTNFFNIQTFQSFPGADTVLKDGAGNTFGSAGDFLMYDFTGDGNPDLVILHPVEQKLSFRLGTGNNSGRLFAEDTAEEIQILDTLENPVSIDLIKSTTISVDGFMDLLVTNQGANSVSVYQRNPNSTGIGDLFRSGIHLNVGASGNIFSKSVVVTDTVFLGKELSNSPTNLPTDTAPIIGLAHTIWDGYYYGQHSTSFPFYHTGILSTQRTTSGIVSVQSSPEETFSILGSFLTTEGLIFNTSRSVQGTTFPIILETTIINDDLIPDLVVLDSVNQKLSVILSDNGRSITYDPDRKDYDLTGVGAGLAIGDLNESFDNDLQTRNDIVVSNFDQSSITIFFNGGKPTGTGGNEDFIFNHPGFPTETISVGRGPRGLTIADLDEDGHNDIAVANEISNNLAIIYHKGDVPQTFTYHNPVYYTTGFSPSSVIAMRTRTHRGSSSALLDLLVLNEDSEDVSILLNKSNQGSRGFENPRSIKISEQFPSFSRLINISTEQRQDPFNEIPRIMRSGDFGNITTHAAVKLREKFSLNSEDESELATETLRYQNLIIGQKRMLYSLKNIGAKEYSAYRAAITSFTVENDGRLTFDSLRTFDDGVVKSLITSGSDIFLNRTQLSERIWLGGSDSQSSLESSVYTTSLIHVLPLGPDVRNSAIQTISDGLPPADSALDIRFSQLGAGLEAMTFTSNPYTGVHHIYALHSGRDKGVLELKNLSTLSPSVEYVFNSLRQTPTQTTPRTSFSTDVSLFEPGGMTLDPNSLSLLLVDRGNQFIRVVDLEDNVTRTMPLRGSANPILENIVDITNVKNTFNYYVITNDRRLYLINPSDSPISVTTQVFSIDFTTESSFDWFKVESRSDFLYIGARDTNEPPTSGKIYKIDLTSTPLGVTEITLANSQSLGGLGGFTLDPDGNTLYYSEKNNFLIKKLDLSAASLVAETIAGISGLRGHFDGAVSTALINSPGDLALNKALDKVIFLDGPTVRSLGLSPSAVSGDLELSTISGDPARTGILDGDGQRARFILPAYLFYEFKNGKDTLYLSDELAHNVRKVEIDP